MPTPIHALLDRSSRARTHHVLRTLMLCVVVALTGACNRPNWDSPVSAYQSFLRALAKGEAELAYSALSSDTRALLAKRAEEISAASGGSVRNDPAAIFFVNAAKSPAVREVTLVSQTGDQAVVSVVAGGKASPVRMVKEAGGWRIELSPEPPATSPGVGDGGTPATDAGG